MSIDNNLQIAINQIATKCDEMISSRYILSDKKISDLLKCIVTNSALHDLAKECLLDYNYEMEFLKCKTPNANGNINRFKLNIPSDNKNLFAFVFCMLSEFDCKTKDVSKFLGDYFYVDGSMYEGYSEFCKQIIKPFKNAAVMLLSEMAQSDMPQDESNLINNSNMGNFTSSMIEEILVIAQELTSRILSENSINANKKQELLSVIEGLTQAVINRDAKLIKILWIGVKNTFKPVKCMHKIFVKLEEKMLSYWLI